MTNSIDRQSREWQQAVADLESRIAELQHGDEAAFGDFTALDWAACMLLSFVLPYLAFLWFW